MPCEANGTPVNPKRVSTGIGEIDNLSFLCLRVDISLHFPTEGSEGGKERLQGKTLSVRDGEKALLPCASGRAVGEGFFRSM